MHLQLFQFKVFTDSLALCSDHVSQFEAGTTQLIPAFPPFTLTFLAASLRRHILKVFLTTSVFLKVLNHTHLLIFFFWRRKSVPVRLLIAHLFVTTASCLPSQVNWSNSYVAQSTAHFQVAHDNQKAPDLPSDCFAQSGGQQVC